MDIYNLLLKHDRWFGGRCRTWMFIILAWWFGESNVPKPSSDSALPTQLLCLNKTVQLVDQVSGRCLELCTVLKYKGSEVCLFYVVILHPQPCEPVHCRHQNRWKRKVNSHSSSNILLISQKCNNRTGTLVLFVFKYKFTAQRVVEKMALKIWKLESKCRRLKKAETLR